MSNYDIFEVADATPAFLDQMKALGNGEAPDDAVPIQLRFDEDANKTYIEADFNHDNVYEATVELDGYHLLQLVVGGFNTLDAGGDGWGDIETRMKINLWGNDGGKTAFGVMPFNVAPKMAYLVLKVMPFLPSGVTDSINDPAGKYVSSSGCMLAYSLVRPW